LHVVNILVALVDQWLFRQVLYLLLFGKRFDFELLPLLFIFYLRFYINPCSVDLMFLFLYLIDEYCICAIHNMNCSKNRVELHVNVGKKEGGYQEWQR